MDNPAIIDNLAGRVIDATEGHSSALKLYIELKELETHVKGFLDSVKPSAMEEAEQWKGQDFHGFTIGIRSGGRWDYKHIEQWNKIKSQLTAIEKAAQHAAKANGGILLSEDAEVIEPAIYKPNADSIDLKPVK